jgi:hypothetical protein
MLRRQAREDAGGSLAFHDPAKPIIASSTDGDVM